MRQNLSPMRIAGTTVMRMLEPRRDKGEQEGQARLN